MSIEHMLDDLILPFEIAALDVRGRMVRAGSVIDQAISRQDYPEPVAQLLGEAVALTGLLAAMLKFDGKLILQTQTDGPVNLIVVDVSSDGRLRGLARFDAGRLGAHPTSDRAGPADLLGQGHMAMTIDQGGQMDRYQGVVALDGQDLAAAADLYFRQSEQIPTALKLAAGPIIGAGGTHWRAGGILVQHLPREGGVRQPDFDPGDVPDGFEITRPEAEAGNEADEPDDWTKTRLLLETVEDHELLDPTLAPERLLYRLFHEDGVRVFASRKLEWHCHCSRERTIDMLGQFSPEDRNFMVKDGKVTAVCEFCNAVYAFDPEELK